MLRQNIRLYVVSCSLTLASSARASFLSPTYPAKHPHLPTKARYPTSCIRTNARNRNIIKIATPVLRGSDDGVDEDSKEQSYKKESKMKILSPFVSVFSAAALFSIGCTLWSEYTVIMTGCGPMLLPDVVERSCYLGVLVIAGSSGEKPNLKAGPQTIPFLKPRLYSDYLNCILMIWFYTHQHNLTSAYLPESISSYCNWKWFGCSYRE